MRRTPDWFRSTHLVACCLCWAIGSVLFACGAPERDETPAERAPSTTADDPRLLRVAIVPAPVSTDPRTPRSPGRLDLVRYLYPALLSVKADPDGTVRFERDLATRWTWDKVEHRLVVDLSARRRWSNGAPIVAEDVAESFRWHLRNGRSSGTADLREVTAPQPGQVSLSFRENVSERRALRIACAPILSAGERAPASGRTLRGEEPVLGGAVRLAARDAHSLVLVPSGVTDAMRIPGILLETVPGADARLLRVAAGVSDLALDVPVHVIRDLGLGNGVIHDAGPGGVEMVCWNLRRPRLGAALRRASTLAIDRGRLAELFRLGETLHGGPADGLFAPEATTAEQDLAGAQAVLAAVPDSLRTIELLYDRGNEVREQLVTYLEEDLARIGVRLVPVALEGAEVMRRFRAGAFDAVVLGFTPAALPDPSPLFASGGAWNGMGFHDARVDSLCAALRVAPSADIDSLLAAVDARVRQTMPVTFLVHHRRIDVVSPRVLGFDGTVWLPLGSLDELRTRDE